MKLALRLLDHLTSLVVIVAFLGLLLCIVVINLLKGVFGDDG